MTMTFSITKDDHIKQADSSVGGIIRFHSLLQYFYLCLKHIILVIIRAKIAPPHSKINRLMMQKCTVKKIKKCNTN